MRNLASIRFAATACVALSTTLFAQTRPAARSKPPTTAAAVPATLPPTPPTVAPVIPPTPAQLPAQVAGVDYANGLLTVSAHNSSLNQILRDISRETRMKITGGVVDERVFGQYGPASVSEVLNTLLDGTTSNMLLVDGNGASPAELILSPRGGGPSPPSPNAGINSIPQSRAPQQVFRPGPTPYSPTPNLPTNASESGATPAEPAAQEGSEPPSPNAVKTPQDIYNQLQKLRQQQAQHSKQQ